MHPPSHKALVNLVNIVFTLTQSITLTKILASIFRLIYIWTTVGAVKCGAQIMWTVGPFIKGTKSLINSHIVTLDVFTSYTNTPQCTCVCIYGWYWSCYKANSLPSPDLLLSFPPSLNDLRPCWSLSKYVWQIDDRGKERHSRTGNAHSSSSPDEASLCVHGGMEQYGSGNTAMQDRWMTC